jgi:signal peptidase
VRVVRSLFGSLLVAAALALAALMLVPPLVGLERYVITTGSMTGSIDAGSLVFDEMVPTRSLREGDVITFNPPEGSGLPGLVTHRIHRLEHDGHGRPVIITKGDANEAPDRVPFVATRPEMARVAFHLPHVGRVYGWLNTPLGRILVFALPAVLIGLGAVRSLWREAGEATVAGSRGAA